MIQQTQTRERYLTQKELVGALESEFGLTLSVRYIQSVKSASLDRGDGLFIAGKARATEVYEWLKRNPRFAVFKPGIS